MNARRVMSVSAVLGLIVLFTAFPAHAQCPLDTLTGVFGDAIAMDGDVAVFGTPYAGSFGSAQVYRWNGVSWVHEAVLRPNDGCGDRDYFGSAVDISGDVVVVGSEGGGCDGADCTDCASIYIFRFDGIDWIQEAKFARPEIGFGESLAVSGDVVLTSAPGVSYGCGAGEAYFYRYDGTKWALEWIIGRVAPFFDCFGWSVAIDGDTAVIHAVPSCADGPGQCGVAHVFREEFSRWEFEQTLRATDEAPDRSIGGIVDLHGDRAVFGVPGRKCDHGSYCGATYVFRRWGDIIWLQEQILTAAIPAPGDRFGSAVAIDGETVLVGAPQYNIAGGNAGLVYEYRFDGAVWTEHDTHRTPPLTQLSNASFGSLVAMSGDVAVVGAPGAGAAYTYALTGSDCDNNGALDVCEGLGVASTSPITEACVCVAAEAPETAPGAVGKNRFISLGPSKAARGTALRVTLQDLPAPYDVMNGQVLWVGKPAEVSDAAASVDPADAPGFATFLAATLQCEPFYANWSLFDSVHLYHAALIPGATYAIQAIDMACNVDDEFAFSDSLNITLERWGDTVGDCTTLPCSAPNGVVQILDALAIVQKFVNAPASINKIRADLEPATPDLLINITDVFASITGFLGLPYPFPPDAMEPCN